MAAVASTFLLVKVVSARISARTEKVTRADAKSLRGLRHKIVLQNRLLRPTKHDARNCVMLARGQIDAPFL
jgi:hypothetical protein